MASWYCRCCICVCGCVCVAFVCLSVCLCVCVRESITSMSARYLITPSSKDHKIWTRDAKQLIEYPGCYEGGWTLNFNDKFNLKIKFYQIVGLKFIRAINHRLFKLESANFDQRYETLLSLLQISFSSKYGHMIVALHVGEMGIANYTNIFIWSPATDITTNKHLGSLAQLLQWKFGFVVRRK